MIPNFSDFKTRREAAKALWGFCHVYLAKGMSLRPAGFHEDMVAALGDPNCRMLEILGFRSSAKSFYGSLALPLWCALVYPEKYPFIVLVGDTFLQSSQTIANLKDQLDNNLVIKNDFGVVVGNDPGEWTLEGPEWQKQSLTLSNGVRIIARSRGQKIRGLRHRFTRPSLIVVDDPEVLDWVRTKENRDKSEQWLLSEVIPAMDVHKRKLVLIGNLLHEDCLLARMKDKMDKVLEYRLAGDYRGTDYEGLAKHSTWPALYPTAESIKKLAELVGPESFSREYLLQIRPPQDQIIKPEDITYYDELPESYMDDKGLEHIVNDAGFTGHGIDCALSQKESADFMAMVDGKAFFFFEGRKEGKLYVLPHPYNEHVRLHDFIQHMKQVDSDGWTHLFYVEANNVGEAVVQEMERELLAVERFTATRDKRIRLEVVAPYIRNGTVRFPRTGAEQLLQQIFGLGTEKHDDLCDAFVWLIWGMVKSHGLGLPKIGYVDM
jgi:predicted phage terminase large subunit-like protein